MEFSRLNLPTQPLDPPGVVMHQVGRNRSFLDTLNLETFDRLMVVDSGAHCLKARAE